MDQLVLVFLTHITKQVILGIGCVPFNVFQVHTQHVVRSGGESCPVPTKIHTFVVVPVAVEINRAVQSLQEHSPSSTVRCLVTKYIKGRQLIRFNGVTISWFTRGFVDFCAVSFD